MSKSSVFADMANQGVDTTEFGVLDGVTATTAELNVLDGGIPETVSLLATSNLTGSTASVSFDGHFSSTYRNYQVIASNITLVAGSGTPALNVRFRRDDATITTSHYAYVGTRHYISDSGLTAVHFYDQDSIVITTENIRGTGEENASFMLYLYDPLGTNNYKVVTLHAIGHASGDDTRWHMAVLSGTLTDTNGANALSGISFHATGTNMLRGNFKLYGIR